MAGDKEQQQQLQCYFIAIKVLMAVFFLFPPTSIVLLKQHLLDNRRRIERRKSIASVK